MTRPTIVETMMTHAAVAARRGTCARRQVGCVLTDERGAILAVGYNGVARGQRHCTDKPCPGAKMLSGFGLDRCEAIHAEQNALLQCHRMDLIAVAYCTTMPCVHCIKMLLNTSCHTIWYRDSYPHEEATMNMWVQGSEARSVYRYVPEA